MDVAEVLSHLTVIQKVMKEVMKPDVHYGKIPGTPKPTLLKPGAELLCMVFHIAPSYRVEDLSTADSTRYRVTCHGSHQGTGVVLGEGMGEAASTEEKYKWRKAICDEEWNEAMPDRRREKFGRGQNGVYRQKQIRTEAADAANTVLKMANKRAQVAMVLNVLAASDMFSQDLEDLEAGLRENMVDGSQAAAAQDRQEPEVWPDASLEKRFPVWRGYLSAGKTHDDLISFAKTKGALTAEQEKRIRALTPLPEAATADAPQQDPQAAATPASQPVQAAQDAPAVTFAQVVDGINAAATSDALAEAGSLIEAVADEGQRKELGAIYDRREAELINKE